MCKNCMFFISTLVLASIETTLQFQKPCEDLSEECLTKTFQMALPDFAQAIPELGLKSLDPYSIEKLDVVLPGGISIQFREGVAKGLKKCNVDFARLAGNTLETQLHCNLTIRGKYKSQGRMLVFPIDGNGDASIICRNIKIYSVVKLKSKVEADGEKYLEIAESKVDHSYDGRVSYSMTNLLRGNPELSAAVLNFMNENWQLVAEEFGGPLVEYGVSAVFTKLKKLLNIIPMNRFVPIPLNL